MKIKKVKETKDKVKDPKSQVESGYGVKYYGFFDNVRKVFSGMVPLYNDEEAERAAVEVCKNKENVISQNAKDYKIVYLFTIDVRSGVIVDNNVHDVYSLSSLPIFMKGVPADGN